MRSQFVDLAGDAALETRMLRWDSGMLGCTACRICLAQALGKPSHTHPIITVAD
jgi:hypothetical protein